ncbi:hypothetical protein HPB48_003868 [Haemaphysalis longicornis]|uniref:protein-serine/threonine phosphatase n=1 Tax=Haemaphysalis longicornis TaxID=44386 RepID=A0A9J6FEJ9_HAELO|nr:hypothetical protein HPB48_003868 [Haemaphysalis longicornis]
MPLHGYASLSLTRRWNKKKTKRKHTKKQRLSELDALPTKDTETAGYDSWCTAVVSNVRGRYMAVVNLGDFRCVVCRSGQTPDMSLDHYTEDKVECSSIRPVAGRITEERRVHGGLNPSRATGDHAYKQNKLWGQMITSPTDITTLQINPDHETSLWLQPATRAFGTRWEAGKWSIFVKPELVSGAHLWTSICEKFDAGLPRDTSGDRNGWANMTCVIVWFRHLKGGDRSSTATRVSSGRYSRLKTIQGRDDIQRGKG